MKRKAQLNEKRLKRIWLSVTILDFPVQELDEQQEILPMM